MREETLTINSNTGDPAADIALDTIAMKKQALVFVNTKRSAEAVAENIAKKNRVQGLTELSEQILKAVSSPTKQCKRLAYCVERGIAFHHAGLTGKQRELVQDAFIEGNIKIISATPTLAAGVNIPAFRTIIRDLKRFSGTGMVDIPVLEYLQMAGRSGRPDFNDEYGEAIVIAKSLPEKEGMIEEYLKGEPEDIWSKVSSQPVLRTYCLSLVSTEIVKTADELKEFFEETFFAHQYGDAKGIRNKIDETISQLQGWEFIKPHDDFASADDLNKLEATLLGKRISQLYLDPLTASIIIKGLKGDPNFFALLQLMTSTLEMRPLLRIKTAEYEEIQQLIDKTELLTKEPSVYDSEYDIFLETIKTAQLLESWADEEREEVILEKYNVRPGELRVRLDIADWLMYSSSEIARLLKKHQFVTPLQKARKRLKYGAKEELLPLLAYKNIGRIRARMLFRNAIKNTGDIKKAEIAKLQQLLGNKVAVDLKKQVGQEVEITAKGTRKGQLSLEKDSFNK